jgi:hypothetical protein
VPGAGAGGAGYDVQFLAGHGRADQYHGADAGHRVVNGGGHVQVTLGDLRARLGQRRRLRRVAHQNPDGLLERGHRPAGSGDVADLMRYMREQATTTA